MKKEVVCLSCAFGTALCGIVCAISFSGQLLGSVLGICFVALAALLLGIGLNEIIRSVEAKNAQKLEKDVQHSTQVLAAIEQIYASVEEQQKSNLHANEESTSKVLERLSACEKSTESFVKDAQALLQELQNEMCVTISEHSQTQLAGYNAGLNQVIQSLENIITVTSSINDLKAAIAESCDKNYKLLDQTYQDNQAFQKIWTQETNTMKKVLGYSDDCTIKDDVQAIKQIVEQLPDAQTENMNKIREAIEECTTDSTEDLGEKFETQMSEMRRKIDEEISTAKNLLTAYRAITDQDVAQIQAILEDQHG